MSVINANGISLNQCALSSSAIKAVVVKQFTCSWSAERKHNSRKAIHERGTVEYTTTVPWQSISIMAIASLLITKKFLRPVCRILYVLKYFC